MATTKKTTKKAPSKPVTRTHVKRVSPVKAPPMRSFAKANAPLPFFTFKFTQQTVYWLILSAFVLLLGVWVIRLNDQVQQIYDQIDKMNTSDDSVIVPAKKTN